MKTENVVREKSFKFALKIVDLYKYLFVNVEFSILNY